MADRPYRKGWDVLQSKPSLSPISSVRKCYRGPELANSDRELANCCSCRCCGAGESLDRFIWQSDRRVQTLEGVHTVQNLTTGTADQRVTAVESLCDQRLATVPGRLFQLVSSSFHVRELIKAYLVQGQERIQFDEAMEVSEEDLDWDEFNVLWMVIEMWPEFDGFGEEKPSDKEIQCIERGHVG